MFLQVFSIAIALAAHTGAFSIPPLSNVDPRTLYPTVHRDGGAKPSAMFGSSVKPKPTNAWWENLVLASPDTLESNVFQMPYTVMAGKSKLQTMVPYPTHVAAIQTFDKGQAVSFSTVEKITGPIVDDWDELSVTLDWSGGVAGKGMKTHLVRGSPYMTAEFSGVTPLVSTQETLHGTSVYVDGKEAICDGTSALKGSMFVFNFTASQQRWLMFAPHDSEWICRAAPFSMTAKSSLHGAVRLALSGDAAYEDLLIKHAGRYPVGSSVSFKVDGDVGTVFWRWNTSILTGWPDTTLLQLAWPVHLPLLSSSLRETSAANPATPFKDLRGAATAVIANTWNLTYQLFPDVGFQAPRPVKKSMKSKILNALRGSNSSDSNFDLPLNYQIGAGDTYFAGKMIARIARLLAIADELGEASTSYFKDMLNRLTQRLEVWLGQGAKSLDPLLYDASWGGIVACGCNYDDCGGKCKPHCANSVTPPERCPAMAAAGVNFGNAFYNDHHFHYGYFVYAAAVAAKYNPAWEQKWRQQILALIRDYGNPSTADPSFPVARHKDWFLGSSWAGGITTPFMNGRNQESTSEAINAYYAVYVYGSAVSAPFAQGLKDLGRLLTAMEVHGADTYWHVRKNSKIYDKDFPFEYPTVAMLWSNMANHQTYFGMQTYYVEGIHLLPITPVMESYLKPDWVAIQFPPYKAACDSDAQCLKGGFSWQVCLEQGLVDEAGALKCLESLPSDAFSGKNAGSNGNSLTNSLHWLATRAPTPPSPPAPSPPGPSPPAPSPPAPPAPSPPSPPAPHHCNFGDTVNCPGTSAKCAGDQCCAGGFTCPSAHEDFKGCAKGKKEDCTKQLGAETKVIML